VVRVDLERPQVARVDPDDPRPRRQRGIELAPGVDLDERLQPQVSRAGDEAGEALRRVERGEQQDQVRPRGPQDRQLARVDDELLGQDRDGDRSADAAQVSTEREPVRLAEGGDDGGAARP
jgi:hypothetical protein